jgi:serine/threonine-protein kinase
MRRRKRFVIILLVLGSAAVPAGHAARPSVVLTAAPVEARAGTPFTVSLAVRGTTERARVVATSPLGTVGVVARRTGRAQRAILTVPGPGDWRLTARIGRRSYPLATIDVRSAGANLMEPFRVAVAPDGTVVIANGRGHGVLAVRDGRLVRIAGNGSDGYERDGVPATTTAVGFVTDVAVAPDGDVYIVSAHRVRRLDARTGLISTFAGGIDGYSGDGGPAAAAQLDGPVAVAVNAHEDVFIAEAVGRVRYVDAHTGVISTYAGIGRQESSGDGGPATAAGIDRPHGLAVGPDGALYIADTYGGRVRRVDWVTKRITSVASGLLLPVHMAVAPDGSILVADTQRTSLRRIGPDGAETQVGRGFVEPSGVAVGADGAIYVSDVDGRRVTRIDGAGRMTTVAR